jgi:integrase
LLSGLPGAADRHGHAKDYLSPAEVTRLLEAAKAGRHGTRDHLILLMMFRHGLRVSEATDWTSTEPGSGLRRLKGGLSVEQPTTGDELRAIKRYLAMRADAQAAAGLRYPGRCRLVVCAHAECAWRGLCVQ